MNHEELKQIEQFEPFFDGSQLRVLVVVDEGRATCKNLIKKLSGSSQKVRRAQILLKADTVGPNWVDAQIADAFNGRT